jgi:hypothetical protein
LKSETNEPIAKVVLLTKKRETFLLQPLTLSPFPPKVAREVVAPQSCPASFGGRMSEGQKGSASNTDFCKRLKRKKYCLNLDLWD